MPNNSTPNIPLIDRWHSWQQCFYDTTDHNNLANQFLTFNYYHAIYIMSLEDRRITLEQFPTNTPLNPEFYSMLDNIYFEAQQIRLRRIRDTKRSSINVNIDRDVCSLFALLNDIESHRNELTRAEFIKIHSSALKSRSDVDTDQLLEQANEIFDKISGVEPNTRSNTDIPGQSFFSTLYTLLNNHQSVYDHADKFSAHLSTTANRSKNLTDQKLHYLEAFKAFKALYSVFAVLFFLLNIELPFLFLEPTPTLSKYWVCSQIDPKYESALFDKYISSAKEFHHWNTTEIPNLWNRIYTNTKTEHLKKISTNKPKTTQ